MPLVCHAEGRTTAAILLLAELADRPVHIAHVARREEVNTSFINRVRGLYSEFTEFLYCNTSTGCLACKK